MEMRAVSAADAGVCMLFPGKVPVEIDTALKGNRGCFLAASKARVRGQNCLTLENFL